MVKVSRNVAVLVVGIFLCGNKVVAMEQQVANPGFWLQRRGEKRRQIDQSAFYLTPVVAEHGRQNLEFVYNNARPYMDSAELPGPSLLSCPQKNNTSGVYTYDKALMLACGLYAKTMATPMGLQSLLKDGPTAHNALELVSPLAMRVASFLYKDSNAFINSLIYGSADGVMRCLTLTPQQENRQDGFLLIPASNDADLVYVKRDFCDDFDGLTEMPLYPWTIQYSGRQAYQVLDQIGIAHMVDKARGCKENFSHDFEARTFKISADGSFMLGFCGSHAHDIDSIVFFERDAEKNLLPKKTWWLSTGILTRRYPASLCEDMRAPKTKKLRLSAVYGCAYDIQTSFALHPYDRKAAYIDTEHAICCLDFDANEATVLERTCDAHALTWSPDGGTLAWVTSAGKLCIRNVHGETQARDWSFGHAWNKMQWNYDGSKVLLVADDAVFLVDAIKGIILEQFTAEHEIIDAVLSYDSNKLVMVTAADYNSMEVWQIAPHKRLSSCLLDYVNVLYITLSKDANSVGICYEKNGAIASYLCDMRQCLYASYEGAGMLRLGARLQHNPFPPDSLSLPQMLLFVAAARTTAGQKLDISRNKYLVSHFKQLAPHLRKCLESKVIV